MKEALALLRVPKNIQVVNLTKKAPRIMVDVEKMKRTFANMIKNAVDAMPKGGTLTIKSKESKNDLEIAFADTGIGMTECMVEKIFTPLFRRKRKEWVSGCRFASTSSRLMVARFR
jgi:signal transduction histidine kinase